MITPAVAQIIPFEAPTLGEFVALFMDFLLASLIKYWWVIPIIVLVWYARWYRVALGGSREPATTAVQLLIQDIANLTFRGITAASALGIALAAGITWWLAGIGTIAIGAIQFDPVMFASLTTIIVSIIGGIGNLIPGADPAVRFFRTTPLAVAGVFAFSLLLAWFGKIAVESVD